jgi:hypothetical protein
MKTKQKSGNSTMARAHSRRHNKLVGKKMIGKLFFSVEIGGRLMHAKTKDAKCMFQKLKKLMKRFSKTLVYHLTLIEKHLQP